MGSSVIPPLPPGFTLDKPGAGGGLPPLPPGFTLDAVDPDAGTLDEEPRTPGIGEDPRVAPDAAFNDAQSRNVGGSVLSGYGTYATVGTGVGPATGPAVVRALPYVGGAVMGGRELARTGDPIRAGAAALEGYFGAKGLIGGGRGLLAKLGARAAARAAPAAVEAAAPIAARAVASEAAPAAETAAAALPGVGDATPAAVAARAADRKARQAAALAKRALTETAPVTEAVTAPAARTVADVVTEAPAVRKLAPIPAKGNVKMATVYTKPPMQGPKLPNAAQEALKAKQLEAARAAGMDVGEAFGTAPVVAQKAEQAAEGALMTRLRASVMMKKDPAGLVNEVTEKAAELAGKGLSREQVGAQIEALYGLTPDKIRQLAAGLR